MKKRLWIKLTLSFSLVILVGTLVTTGIIQGITANRFLGFIKAEDRRIARRLGPMLEDAYRQEGNWRLVQKSLSHSPFWVPFLFSSEEDFPSLNLPKRHRTHHMRDREWEWEDDDDEIIPGLIDRILITDVDGHIVVDSRKDRLGSEVNSDILEQGIWLQGPQGPVGRLFIDSMATPILSPLGVQFLSQIRQAALFSVLVMVVVSLGAVILLVRNITGPLNRMGEVAGRIAQGEFKVRTKMRRTDELGDLGRSIDDMAGSLQRAEEAKRRLIADSAHELRTPMTLIQGNLEMILEGVYEGNRDRLEMIYRETELMSRLIGDLQSLADWEAGNIGLEKTEVSLPILAREVMELFHSRWQALGTRIIFPETGGYIVLGDAVRLKQVFLNIYSNALRYLPPQGELTVSFAKETDGVTGSIDNSGPPLPEGEEKKIFERFYRIDGSRNRSIGGRGLGLAITREIITAHGGRIWAENLPGLRGVRFSFFLPKK